LAHLDRNGSGMSLDLQIPLWGIITMTLGLLGQTAALLIWGARIDQRVSQTESDIASLQSQLAAQAKMVEVVGRLDERTQALVVTVNRIDARTSGGGRGQ